MTTTIANRGEQRGIIDQPPDEEREAALTGLFASMRQIAGERREAVDAAIPALNHLCEVMTSGTNQAFHLRALLYSLWNGQPTPLYAVLDLDWQLRKELCAVVLAFGYEDSERKFFYDAIKSAVTARGIWAWFLEAHNKEAA